MERSARIVLMNFMAPGNDPFPRTCTPKTLPTRGLRPAAGYVNEDTPDQAARGVIMPQRILPLSGRRRLIRPLPASPRHWVTMSPLLTPSYC